MYSPYHRSQSHIHICGVPIANVSRGEAISILKPFLEFSNNNPKTVFFVNARTINLIFSNTEYKNLLKSATILLPDGSGILLAGVVKSLHFKNNLNGTDFIPAFLKATTNGERKYFFLGARPKTIAAASAAAVNMFPGWNLVGYHHGYLDHAQSKLVIRKINATGSNLLLIGMGNPVQEKWICRYRDDLNVPLCIAVGGLFSFWAGNRIRAPLLFRRFGLEWFWILLTEHHKWRRYTIDIWSYLLSFYRFDLVNMQRNRTSDIVEISTYRNGDSLSQYNPNLMDVFKRFL